MNRYLIIADDFTGANDTGVQLARRGIPTSVTLKYNGIHPDSTSYVLDTESRGMDREKAYSHVKHQVSHIDFSGFHYIIKKVDSTLRGNIAMEVKAIDEIYRSELIIFMPALPDLGRTTFHGIHHLNGTPITETELAKDPVKPVTTDRLDHLLREAYEETVTHIGLDIIRDGNIPLEMGRIFTFDAETNEDMQAVVRAAERLNKRTLWVGSAAIADNLLEQELKVYPSMALIASVSEVSRMQVKYAEKNGTSLISIPIYNMLDDYDASEYVDEASRLLSSGRDVILLSSATYDRDELERTVIAGELRGMKREEVSAVTQMIMGEMTKKILEKVKVSGLFLAGGDTAIGFFDRVDADGSVITGEMSTGIPMMRLSGGMFDGLKVITKAGAFGNEDAVFYGLRKLKEAQ